MVDSVLMLTTAGSSWRAICENWFDSCCGDGTCSGVASDDEAAFSLPFTPADTTVPIRMPSESVARMTRVEAKRLAFSLLPETHDLPIHCMSSSYKTQT